MIEYLTDMFSYSFMTRALVVGVLLSLCASLLGVSLVLKKYSMIGDGLSHVGFGALAIASALNTAPLTVAIPIVVISAFLILRISETSGLKGDTSIALISTGSLAVGVTVISMTSGMNTDVYNYMFGSILSMTKTDVCLSIVLSVVVIALFVLFYNCIFTVTFDETFSKATGINASFYNSLIALLTAITVVLGMRIMGALLISGIIIFPSVSAMRVFKTFKSVTVFSALISVVSFLAGLLVSYEFDTPTGASIILINILILGICSIIKRGWCKMHRPRKANKRLKTAILKSHRR